jgi:hypothetical protein
MAHKQCEHTELSGLETGVVEVVLGRCEIGQDCPGLAAGCPYAWKGSVRRNRAVNAMFTEWAEKKYAPQPIGFVG